MTRHSVLIAIAVAIFIIVALGGTLRDFSSLQLTALGLAFFAGGHL